MKVNNHRDFAYFDYVSESCPLYQLGDVVLKEPIEGTQTNIEIGVIVQIHEPGEYRVDMWGNCCLAEIRLATKEEIEMYRPELMEQLLSH